MTLVTFRVRFLRVSVVMVYPVALTIWIWLPEPLKTAWHRMMIVLEDYAIENHL